MVEYVVQLPILGVALNLGVILFDKLIIGRRSIWPIVGSLMSHSCNRSEEVAGKRHGVNLLALGAFPGGAWGHDRRTRLGGARKRIHAQRRFS